MTENPPQTPTAEAADQTKPKLSAPETSEFGFLRAQMAAHKSTVRDLGLDWFLYRGDILAHYTNLHGLVGIVSSKGFWLSDIRFLNDLEEYDNGRKLALKLIGLLLESIRERPFKRVLLACHELLLKDLEKTYYVASFSKSCDSLEQWRAYANGNDGVCLVFQNNCTKEIGISPFSVLPILSASIAIYDDLRKRRVILRTIARFAIEHRKDIDAQKHTFASWPDLYASHLVSLLSHAFLTFKHPAFETENEVRIIAHSGKLEDFGGLEHRVRDGRIVPYIDSGKLYKNLKLEEKGLSKLPLREIIVGPTAKQDITLRSIRVFLDNSGYREVIVRPSEVPYRG